jgi:hypothetical protein
LAVTNAISEPEKNALSTSISTMRAIAIGGGGRGERTALL